jgi:hypothetical protein
MVLESIVNTHDCILNEEWGQYLCMAWQINLITAASYFFLRISPIVTQHNPMTKACGWTLGHQTNRSDNRFNYLALYDPLSGVYGGIKEFGIMVIIRQTTTVFACFRKKKGSD